MYDMASIVYYLITCVHKSRRKKQKTKYQTIHLLSPGRKVGQMDRLSSEGDFHIMIEYFTRIYF